MNIKTENTKTKLMKVRRPGMCMDCGWEATKKVQEPINQEKDN